MQAMINKTTLLIVLSHNDDVSGKMGKFGKFGIIYYDINQIITMAAMTHTKHFEAYGQMKEIQYKVFHLLKYWMTMQYDNMGQVMNKEMKMGPYINTTCYAYEEDAKSQFQTISNNDRPLWQYSYDFSGNLYLLIPRNSTWLTPLWYNLQGHITRLGDMQ